MIKAGLEGCSAYIDEAVIYHDNWKQHLETIRALFYRLCDAELTINLTKSELNISRSSCRSGHVKPMDAKAEAKNI